MGPRPHGGGWILASLLLALALSVWPLPLDARWWRPDWMLLVVFYWVIAAPQRVGVGSAWLAGLALDIVQGVSLGQNAFALAVIAYVVQVSYQRLRMFSYRKQAVVVFGLVALHILLYQWVQNLLGVADISLLMVVQALISAATWPLVRLLLGQLQSRLAIY